MHSILLHPLHPEQLFVSNQSSTCYLMNMNGQVIKALQSGKRQGGGECERRSWHADGCGCWVLCSCLTRYGSMAVHACPPA